MYLFFLEAFLWEVVAVFLVCVGRWNRLKVRLHRAVVEHWPRVAGEDGLGIALVVGWQSQLTDHIQCCVVVKIITNLWGT